MNVTIFHNPACTTSRNMLALLCNADIEPTIIEYLSAPPNRATLESLIEKMGGPVRVVLREKAAPYAEVCDEQQRSEQQQGRIHQDTDPEYHEGFGGGDKDKHVVGANAATACYGCHTAQKDRDYVFSSLSD